MPSPHLPPPPPSFFLLLLSTMTDDSTHPNAQPQTLMTSRRNPPTTTTGTYTTPRSAVSTVRPSPCSRSSDGSWKKKKMRGEESACLCESTSVLAFCFLLFLGRIQSGGEPTTMTSLACGIIKKKEKEKERRRRHVKDHPLTISNWFQ